IPESPLGRHKNSDGGVSPSFSVSYGIFLSFFPIPGSPLGRNLFLCLNDEDFVLPNEKSP
ncbi:MAG TPA: hypothetical protein PLE33_08125, partial [Candidatus Cloacimonas sp.]|nr:hypothetical protein [Candidatus Cloacimonas sp.]